MSPEAKWLRRSMAASRVGVDLIAVQCDACGWVDLKGFERAVEDVPATVESTADVRRVQIDFCRHAPGTVIGPQIFAVCQGLLRTCSPAASIGPRSRK